MAFPPEPPIIKRTTPSELMMIVGDIEESGLFPGFIALADCADAGKSAI